MRDFERIANIEKVHADRFTRLADEIESGTIFKKDEEIPWICTVCGNIHVGKNLRKFVMFVNIQKDFICPFLNPLQNHDHPFTSGHD